jgi:O-antigen/teichoic acid export membrane protein
LELKKLRQHPKYDTILNWTKLVSITGTAQIIVQAVGFASGILIIRMLPVHEYALYTLCNTMLGTMALLTDGGISNGIMSEGGKVWQNKEKLGAVLVTGLELMGKFAIVSLIVSIPILFYLLLHNGASWLMASLIVLAMIPAFYASMSDSLLEIVPKLHQTILPLQRNQIEVGVGRLVLSALTMFLFPWAFVAVIAAGIPRIWGNIRLRKISHVFIENNQKSDPVVKKEVLFLVKRRMPEVIYYCLSGQINIWLISIFGTTTALANLGALGRFNMITNLFLFVFLTLVVPRFARITNVRRELQNKIIITMSILFVLSVFIIGLSFIFSNQMLWILGKSYHGLNYELILIIISGCLSMVQGVFFSINNAKGWIISPMLHILISVSTTILALFFVDVSTLEGVILFNAIISAIQAMVFIFYCFYKISKL